MIMLNKIRKIYQICLHAYRVMNCYTVMCLFTVKVKIY